MSNVAHPAAAVIVSAGHTWFANGAGATWYVHTADLDTFPVALGAGETEMTIVYRREADNVGELVDAMTAAGWRTSETGRETGWFVFRKAGSPDCVIGFARMWPVTHPMFEDADAPTIARRLAKFRELVGTTWRGHGGLTGSELLRRSYSGDARRTPMWFWADAGNSPAGCGTEIRAMDTRTPISESQSAKAFVHHFDIRAMYLAAASAANVGWTPPRHAGAVPFDPKTFGYWLVSVSEIVQAHAEMPGGIVPDLRTLIGTRTNGDVWLTTPIMGLLDERGVRPVVLDAWVCQEQDERRRGKLTGKKLPGSGQVLRAWAENLRDAVIGATDVTVRQAVKDTYTMTRGLMSREGGRFYRPDWSDAIKDTARANLLRKVIASGYTPVRWQVDSVWIAADDDAATAGKLLDAGERIGKFRWEETTTPAEYVADYERATRGVEVPA